jgi:hypothetical protein
MFRLTSSLLPAGGGSNVELATSEFPTTHTKETFKRIQQFSHSREIANPYPSHDTTNRIENVHPNPSHPSPPSPPMPPASPTSLNMKIAATTHLPAAAAATHISFESIGL